MQMASAVTTGPSGGSTLLDVTDNHKRWIVFGIALNNVLVPETLRFVAQEVEKEYNNLKVSHNIHNQCARGHLKKWPGFLKYENINGNDTLPKLPNNKYDYNSFNFKVSSSVEFAKLYLENHMAKFNAFDEHCDASAVLNLLGKVPVFSKDVQDAANVVRQARNAWAHCVFTDWDEHYFEQTFIDMEKLTKELALARADESKILTNLNEWKTNGVTLCMNANVDPHLVKVVQEHVELLGKKLEKLTFEMQEEENDRKGLKKALDDVQLYLEECEKRFTKIEQRVADLENKQNVSVLQTSYDFASCEGDIKFFAERYDEDTRQWLLKDFDKWLENPGKSRAHVLLGDPAVGKSVIAAVLALRARKAGHLGAAYFCRHYDGTRRDPRYLLGTVAQQLCDCISEYNVKVGGEGGIQRMLANSKLGIHELFTKLLEEPLSKCSRAQQRRLVIVDALDETEYWSRDDFLDLIMNRFPLLPEWLVFFITSRPEDTVQFRLKTYNPCIKICAGNSSSSDVYQQHEQDIVRFLENKVNFLRLPYSAEDVAKKCNGLFLSAFYIVEILKDPDHSSKIDLDHVVPRDLDEFFRGNFKRVFDKVGTNVCKKLFGCALIAPSPLPVSFISFILRKEKSNLVEQEVIDAISLFVLQSCDETFTFVHNLIPEWLTDHKRTSREMLIDRSSARKYFKDIVVEILDDVSNERSENLACIETSVVAYILRVGIRFLRDNNEEEYLSSETVFKCLTNYHFIQKRIQSSRMGIYSLLEDLKFCVNNQILDTTKKEILQDIYFALERDIYILLESPSLLYSCLRNVTKITQENSDYVSATWMESKSVPLYPSCEIARDMNCFALSPDEKLLAGGKGRCIFLFDACSLEKILGPIEVTDKGDILNLEFSPDGNLLFFGRLDRWFSVQEKRVVGTNQFVGNSNFYKWGIFIFDGHYILIRRNRAEMHNPDCSFTLFCKWALLEIIHSGYKRDANRMATMRNLLSDLQSHVRCRFGYSGQCSNCLEFESIQELTLVRRRIVELYPDIFKYQIWNMQTERSVMEEMFSSKPPTNPFFYLCHFYRSESECFATNVDLNPFPLWKFALIMASSHSVHESRHIIEYLAILSEMSLTDCFTVSRVVINTSVKFYNHVSMSMTLSQDGKWRAQRECHFGRVLLFKTCNEFFVDNDKTPDHVINKVGQFAFTKDSRVFLYSTKSPAQFVYALSLQTGTLLLSVSGLNPVYCTPDRELGFVFCAAEEKRIVLSEDLNDLFYKPFRKDSIHSPDRKWFARYRHEDKRVELFENCDESISNYHLIPPDHVINNAGGYTFSKDSSVFLYFTKSPDQHVYALFLQTGTKLLSTLRLNHWYDNPEKEVGDIFHVTEKERVVLSINLPESFLAFSLRTSKFVIRPVNLTFTSADTIMCVWSDGTYLSLKTNDSDRFLTHSACIASVHHSSSHVTQVEKCAFSQDGKLLVIHQGFDIFLFEDGKFLCLIFHEKSEYSVPCLTFSTDSTLLLCCIQKSNDNQYFYVWNVQKKVMSEPFELVQTPFVDRCCFASGNTKIIFCNKSLIDIREYPVRTRASWRLLETNVPCKEFDKCTHCTVSSDNELLACCIVNKILVCPLNNPTQRYIRQVPNSHLGRIEFCQFLKRSRYLISYGIDGVVFLFDLSEWKIVSFVRIGHGQANIVSMVVSPKEDKVVCLKSSGSLSVIRLHGLKSAVPPKSPLLGVIRRQQRDQYTPTVHRTYPDKIKSTSAMAGEEEDKSSMSCSDYSQESDEDFLEWVSDYSVDSANEDELD